MDLKISNFEMWSWDVTFAPFPEKVTCNCHDQESEALFFRPDLKGICYRLPLITLEYLIIVGYGITVLGGHLPPEK